MRSLLAFLLILLLFFFAYNFYTYHKLSSAEGAYKLAGIPSSERLIAVYHDSNFWQFATYNPKTQELKVYYINQNSPLFFRTKKTKTVRTPLNYSPLALHLKLLEKAPKETPALLFAGKWYTKENPPKFPTVEQILKQYDNKTIRRIAVLYAKKELWIETYLQVNTRAYEVGTKDVLVIPSFGNTSEGIWVVETPQGMNSTKTVYYPGTKIVGNATPVYLGSFVLNRKSIESAFYEALSNLSEIISFAKIEVYCLSPRADVDTVAIKRYYWGISMKKYFQFHYLHRDTIKVLQGCKTTR
ncbi:hypothetical protein [Thermococcus nautili]|uniref:Uncharacterized protein n=1 Tax=Thermococcus nautili TaxID=195522 RepID=W8PNS9_9EURY|nr:hypothetical protein [Thermococcus nautili]AHL23699.1 hypothetical protein BD01_2103 [Thermococcus nautili]